MGLILNASAETQHFMVFGNHFTLKPGQIKLFTEQTARFICSERTDLGLVDLPEKYEDIEFANSEEGKAILAAKKIEGVNNRIRRLKAIVYNNQVSLKRDLDMANMKVAPELLASDGEIRAMEELTKYVDSSAADEAKKMERISALKSKISKLDK